MLRTGKEHLESLRDGRVIYIGSERVDDVTHHAAFCNAAATVAALYDMKADPANRDSLTYEEDGDRHSIYFLRPRTREDLQRRMLGHRRIADVTFGMFGRSPDHVASFVTGMAIKPDALPAPCAHADNLLRYYRHLRDNDVYVVYAVLPPQAARNPEFYERQNLPVPTLRVVREADDGVVISGMKMLATGALYANEIWIGNVLPLAPDQKKESITCAVPCNAPGLTLWSRKPAVLGATSEFDSPLAWRYDESDSMVLCDNVKVPWEKVFVHDDAVLSRARRAARALRRRRVPNAGGHLGHGRSGPRPAVRELLADAAGRRRNPHEAIQAGVGHGRLGVRRPPPAIREILCRRCLHHPQSFVPRNRLGRVQQAGRGLDGELRLSGRTTCDIRPASSVSCPVTLTPLR